MRGGVAAPQRGSARPGRGIRLVGNDWSVLEGMRPDPAPLVSVVVTHYDQPAELARTLAALREQTHPRIEVIVVDDGSPVAPEVPEGVRLLRMEDLGFRAAAARNLGAAHAAGEVLCFLDADTTPEPGYVEALTRMPALSSDVVAVGRRRHADLAAAEAAAAGAAASAASAGGASVAELGMRHELPEPAWLREAYSSSRDLLDADARSYRFVISAVLACSASFFAETGGFDERFDRYGGEDWEWAHRAWTLGAVFAHVPEAVAWHDGPDVSGRGDADELRRLKDAETLTLFGLIGVPGSVGVGLRSAAADVVVELPDADAAATFLAADLLLEALPQARVVVADAQADILGAGDDRILSRGSDAADRARAGARVLVEVVGPFGVTLAARREFVDALVAATAEVGVGSLGTVQLESPGGDVLLAVRSARALARAARWPAPPSPAVPAPFRTETRTTPAAPLVLPPNLESHLARWS